MLEIKGRVSTLTVLKPNGTGLEQAAQQLQDKLDQAPGFFSNTPAVIDLSSSDNVEGLAGFIETARNGGFIPFAYTGVDQQQDSMQGLAWLPDVKMGKGSKEKAASNAEVKETSAMVVTQPVRGGQQIYAKGRDLVVLNAVSPGAEVFADGHIHIYGALRGRAMAGVQGDESARIFCKSLDAELISIAGTYTVNEDIEEQHRNQSVQIGLQDERLTIQSL